MRFKSGVFSLKSRQGKGRPHIAKVFDCTRLKILSSWQLPISLAQVKADNTSERLLYETRQIIYPLYQANQITKKAYNNIMN